MLYAMQSIMCALAFLSVCLFNHLSSRVMDCDKRYTSHENGKEQWDKWSKPFAPYSRQITVPTAHHSIFGAGVVICLERGADLHMAQLMPLPLTVSCFSKIQIGLPFLVPAHLGSPGKQAVKRVCVCVIL